MSDEVVEEKSEIALAIEQRERKLHEFDVEGFFGLGGKKIPKLAIRVLTKFEENQAIVAAHANSKEWARGDNDARADADLLDDLKLKEALRRACFVAGVATKGGHPIQAFPGGRWMEQNLTTEQLAVLHNLLLEARKSESPMLWEIKMQDVLSLAEGCAKTCGSDMPEAMLSVCSREYLTTAFTLLASEWWKLRKVVDDVVHGAGAEHGGGGGGEGAGEAQEAPPADVREGEGGGEG
jgi:hypothetical protein